MLEFIGVCNGVSKGSNGKEYVTFSVAGVVGFLKVSKDYSGGAEVGHKYLLRCAPRKYEDKAFLTFSVLSEV